MKNKRKEQRRKLTKSQLAKNRKKYVKEYLKRDYVKERKKKRNKLLTEKRKEFLEEYKKDKKCNNCGWNEHTEVLQFHHAENNKEKNVSEIRTINCIKKEILKCILLCPNCHFFIHYGEGKNQHENSNIC